jgi:four helix bundle protein
MTYQRFEDLPVWQAAIELGHRVFAITEDPLFSVRGDGVGAGGLQDQIRRAVVSVSNNIAEGFERGSTAEVLQFRYFARGSAGEVRSMLRFMDAWPKAKHLKSQISDLIPLAESCSRQIRGWADSLQNSEIKGQRHLNEQSRGAYEGRKRAEDFQARAGASQEAILERWHAQLARAREQMAGQQEGEAESRQVASRELAKPSGNEASEQRPQI